MCEARFTKVIRSNKSCTTNHTSMETNSIIARGVPSGFQLSSERVYTEENTSHHGYHRLHEHTPGRHQKGAKAIRELRRLLGELYGTFFLTFMGALVIVLEAFHPERVPYGLSGVTASLTLVALIYSEAQISGAHFNPAVTWAFFISGAFKWWRVPLYWMAEVGGATLAAFVLRCLFGTKKGQVGATMPAEDVSDLEAYCFEAIFTFLLVTTIVNTSRRAKVIGPHAALAVGAAHTALTLTGVYVKTVVGRKYLSMM